VMRHHTLATREKIGRGVRLAAERRKARRDARDPISFRSLDKKKPWTLRHCFGKRLATLARSDRVLGQRRGWLIML
jgi:hypothetical protein